MKNGNLLTCFDQQKAGLMLSFQKVPGSIKYSRFFFGGGIFKFEGHYVVQFNVIIFTGLHKKDHKSVNHSAEGFFLNRLPRAIFEKFPAARFSDCLSQQPSLFSLLGECHLISTDQWHLVRSWFNIHLWESKKGDVP